MSGYNEEGDLVWTARLDLGFKMGYSPPFSAEDVQWNYMRRMTPKDSLKRSIINYDASRGDTSIFGNVIRRHQESK